MAPNPSATSTISSIGPGRRYGIRVHGDWWYSGGPTGNQDSASPTIVRYRPSDDRFVHWQGRASMQGGIWPPYGHAHSFDAADLDVSGRKIWRHLGHHNSEPVFNFALGWFNIDTHVSGTVPGDQAWAGDWPSISFMPDNRLLHIIRPQPGGNKNVRRFNVDSLAWVAPLAGPEGDCGPTCYFRGSVYVTTSARHFYAIQPTGSIAQKASTPVLMDRSGNTSHTILCPLGDYVYAFCGNGDIWRYDPAADSWGGSRYHSLPWRLPHHTYDPTASSWSYMSASCLGPVPPQGVALLCMPSVWSSNGSVDARAFVWKP